MLRLTKRRRVRQGYPAPDWRKMAFDDLLMEGWQELPLKELDERIDLISRAAAEQHLNLFYWEPLERMSSRAATLRAEA